MGIRKWRKKEENLLSSLFSPSCIPQTTWSWGQGEFCLLASDQPQTSTLWSCLQSCSRKPGAFQGTVFHPREEKQSRDCPLEIENRQQNSLDLFLSLLSWLTPSQSCWQVPNVMPQSFVYFPTSPLAVSMAWGGAMGTYPVHLIHGGNPVSNAVFAPTPSLVLWLHISRV